MKSLRKSLNGDGTKGSIRTQISIPLPSISKPPSAILPPQKVIRALSNHRSQAPQELSFQKGDFFHVLWDVDDHGAWYEAHNPVTGARGLVPRSMFEEFSRNAISANSSPAGPGAPLKSPTMSFPATAKKPQVFYAVVLHDFEAERADELDAKAGDSITVVAQSNREWFVAKPIGRIGRPGLIPVSFVEVRDPSTAKPVQDVQGLIDRGEIPKVEDWKQSVVNYKQNSIPLGVIDTPHRQTFTSSVGSGAPADQTTPRFSVTSKQEYSDDKLGVVTEVPDPLPDGILLTADVVSFHYEMEEYWFRIDAVYQPYPSSGQDQLPPAKQLILFRVYNDFYDFQVSLLGTFPREAGRESPHNRILPYMPGPADEVDNQLTATRRVELDEYVHNLCDLGRSGHKHILEHQIVREFFALKPGDVENEIEPRANEMDALLGGKGISHNIADLDGHQGDIGNRLERLKVDGEDRESDGSVYEDEGYAPSPKSRTRDPNPYARPDERRSNESDRHPYVHPQNHHQRMGSTSSLRAHSPYASTSRSNSPLHPERSSPLSHSQHYHHHTPSPSTSSLRSQIQPTASRSRSHSTATMNNSNSPAISATNPQPAFVKIKIFDRAADDLIAIRVHPRVTHAELMEKVQTRLGGEVGQLRFRESLTDTYVELDSDEDLRNWMGRTDKLVLYAD